MHAALLAGIELVRVHLLSVAPDAKAATPEAKFVRAGETVTLAAAVEARVDGTSVVYASVPRVDLGDGRSRAATPWPAGEAIEVAWFKVEPTVSHVDNETGGFHWATIEYAETPWPAATARTLSRSADVRATVLPDRGGLGTMAFKVAVTAGGRTLATTGNEVVYRGGLSPKVHRVTVRRDDSFLGYLTELYNTPYIWASAGSAGVHQADRQIGSDCADLMVYGMRRAGKRIDYGSTYDVPRWGGKKPIARIAAKAPDGRFVDDAGHAIRIGDGALQPGDLLLFHRHVGAFSADREPLGVLDENDLLLHTAWAPPAEESFSESRRWTSPPFTVYRVPIP